MIDAFRLGGWGMYPTTLVGLVMIATAILYARRPDPRRLHVVRNLQRLTLLVSCLGFVTGVINSFLATGGADMYEVGSLVVVGVGESLHNLGLGLVLLVIASIATTIGAARCAPRADLGGSELHDPHAT